MARVREHQQDPDAEPQQIVPEDPWDIFLGGQLDETLRPVQQRDRLLNLKPNKTSDEIWIGIENALIVVSPVALAPGDAIAYGLSIPLLVNLWIGYRF